MTQALDPTGSIRSLRVDSEGKLLVTGVAGGGGGGTGDASAANQLTQIARLDTLLAQTDTVEAQLIALNGKTPTLSGGKVPVIDAENRDLTQTIAASIGTTNDGAANSDTATGSQIALQKRALQHLSSLLTQATNFRPVLNSTQSLAVTAASSAAQAVTAGDVLRFSNAGTKPIAVLFGTSGVTAVYASALDIMPGSSEAITVPVGATHFAAICNTGDTGTLKWTRGTGL